MVHVEVYKVRFMNIQCSESKRVVQFVVKIV